MWAMLGKVATDMNATRTREDAAKALRWKQHFAVAKLKVRYAHMLPACKSSRNLAHGGHLPPGTASFAWALMTEMRARDRMAEFGERYQGRTIDDLRSLLWPCECYVCRVAGGDCAASMRIEAMAPRITRWIRKGEGR